MRRRARRRVNRGRCERPEHSPVIAVRAAHRPGGRETGCAQGVGQQALTAQHSRPRRRAHVAAALGAAASLAPRSASRQWFRSCECRRWVGHCRPRTSAIRSLNLGVSFPAVRSRGRPALANPKGMLCAGSSNVGNVRVNGHSDCTTRGQDAILRPRQRDLVQTLELLGCELLG